MRAECYYFSSETIYYAAINVTVYFVGMYVCRVGWNEFRVMIIFMFVLCILINSHLLAY